MPKKGKQKKIITLQHHLSSELRTADVPVKLFSFTFSEEGADLLVHSIFRDKAVIHHLVAPHCLKGGVHHHRVHSRGVQILAEELADAEDGAPEILGKIGNCESELEGQRPGFDS